MRHDYRQELPPPAALPIFRPLAPFQPEPWQLEALRSKASILLLTGSAGGGKSRVAAEKIHAACLKYPSIMALMVRKTRESMTNSTVLFMDRKIIGPDPSVKLMEGKHRFEYRNNSILAYGGMKDDEQQEQILSIGQEGGIEICWLEEATQFTENDFNAIMSRMRGPRMGWTQVILTCNPSSPTHWIHTRLIKGGEAQVVYSGHLDNPHNPEWYDGILQGLTGVYGKRMRDGLWIQAEGAVYDAWDSAVHMVEWHRPPVDARKFRAIDFGYTNPFVCQWWYQDNDGRLVRYREIYRTKRIVEDHAADIVRLTGDEQIEFTVADHDAEDRATLERHGVSTIAAIKDISPGLQAVQGRLSKSADGKPRLFLMRNALVDVDEELRDRKKPTCTEDEIDGYVWPKDKSGKPVKEVPVKENDHGLDAMRYAVQAIDGEGVGTGYLEWMRERYGEKPNAEANA